MSMQLLCKLHRSDGTDADAAEHAELARLAIEKYPALRERVTTVRQLCGLPQLGALQPPVVPSA